MKRLDLIAYGVAEVCGGFYTPQSVLTVKNNEALMKALTQASGIEMLHGITAMCNAIVHAANTRQISVACARGFYHMVFGQLFNKREQRLFHTPLAMVLREEEFRDIFNLSGITVEDEEFHFATPDFVSVSSLISKIMREKKMAGMKPNVQNWLIDMVPPKKPLPVYYQSQRKPGRYGYEHLS